MFNPALAKPVIGVVVGFCSSRLVGQLVAANVAPVTTFQKVQMTIGTYAVGSAVGHVASQAVLADIENTEAAIKAFKDQHKKDEE